MTPPKIAQSTPPIAIIACGFSVDSNANTGEAMDGNPTVIISICQQSINVRFNVVSAALRRSHRFFEVFCYVSVKIEGNIKNKENTNKKIPSATTIVSQNEFPPFVDLTSLIVSFATVHTI